MKTSQKRSIARSLVPSRRSRRPNVSPSCDAGARRPSRVATRATRRRSSSRRCRYRSSVQRPRAERADSPVLVDHGQLEPQAPDRARLPDPLEEAQILGEAAEGDVLAVVGRRRRVAVSLRQGLDGSAECRARLEQGHVGAGVEAVERGGEPGQATPDHRHSHVLTVPRATTLQCSVPKVVSRPGGCKASPFGVLGRANTSSPVLTLPASLPGSLSRAGASRDFRDGTRESRPPRAGSRCR